MGPLHTVSDYAVSIIHKMQNENIKSWAPRQDVTDSFNAHVQEWIKHTVWKDDCRSWYKDNNTGTLIAEQRDLRCTNPNVCCHLGRVNAVWPGSSMHYQQAIAQPRYEDFDIEYNDKNPWAFLGLGYTVENRKGVGEADCSPYLNLNNIDPKWRVRRNLADTGFANVCVGMRRLGETRRGFLSSRTI